MVKKKAKRRSLSDRLKVKYRLVVMNDETFKEQSSLLITPLNVLILGGAAIIFGIVLVTYIIAFTPLREYIPGYADFNLRMQVYENTLRADSLERELTLKDLYLKNLNRVIAGEVPVQRSYGPDTSRDYSAIDFTVSEQDSLLRAMVEDEEKYNVQNLQIGGRSNTETDVRNLYFMVPIKGEITDGFDISAKHYGVDIVTKKSQPIKATLGGTVFISTWTYDAGHVIGIQHTNNLCSFYKHCSVLLKKAGESVQAGDVIAVVGNSGEMTTGPHLHFELWLNARPVNPQDYIVF